MRPTPTFSLKSLADLVSRTSPSSDYAGKTVKPFSGDWGIARRLLSRLTNHFSPITNHFFVSRRLRLHRQKADHGLVLLSTNNSSTIKCPVELPPSSFPILAFFVK